MIKAKLKVNMGEMQRQKTPATNSTYVQWHAVDECTYNMTQIYMFAPTNDPKYSCKIDVSFHTDLENACGFSILIEHPC